MKKKEEMLEAFQKLMKKRGKINVIFTYLLTCLFHV